MQSMPYYQSGYQAPTSYSSNGSPVPSSVMNTAAPPPIMSPMQHPPIPEAAGAPPSQQPPKRKQVKNACTNCQKACKKCDDARPCPRCIKYGIADTCVNSVRKERKKGVKRGPYKRRTKDGSTTTTRKGDEQLMGQPAAQNPYMRPGTMSFAYPGTMNQYGQPAYDPYSSYAAAYHKDMPYVVNPVYSSMGYPAMMPGGDSQQHHHHQQPAAGETPPQQQPGHATAYQQQQQQQHSPVSAQYSTMVHPSASRYGDHVLHSPQSQSPTTAHVYYQQQQQQRQSPQLPEIKSDSAQYMKPQPMTPVPSASNSSITSTPPPHAAEAAGAGQPEEESKYERLSQLCSAALHSTGDSSQQHSSPHQQHPQ